MDYTLLKDTINLVEEFEAELQKSNQYDRNVESFKHWIADRIAEEQSLLNLIGKEKRIKEHRKV